MSSCIRDDPAKASRKPVPYHLGSRLAGDIDSYYVDHSMALEFLGWCAELSKDAMFVDDWSPQSQTPQYFSCN